MTLASAVPVLPPLEGACGRGFAFGAIPFGAADAFTPQSARYNMKPEVGVAAMRSALGSLRPPWESSPFTGPPPRVIRDTLGAQGDDFYWRSGLPGSARGPRRPRTQQAEGRVVGGGDIGGDDAGWDQGSRDITDPREPDTRPYHVARARARGQLRHALGTNDGSAQLRRLEMAVRLPAARDDHLIAPELNRAEREAAYLARRLRMRDEELLRANSKQAHGGGHGVNTGGTQRDGGAASANEGGDADVEMSEEELLYRKEQKAAATRIQSLYRGNRDREEVKQHKQEVKAATMIQSLHRGNRARADVAQRLVEEGVDFDEGEVDDNYM